MSAITIMPAPCWVLADDRTGRDYDNGDYMAHLPSRSEAERFAACEAPEEDIPHLVARKRDKPCVKAACSCCGYVFDETEWVSHFDDEAQALRDLRQCDWTVSEDGTALCWGCGGEAHGACLAHEEASADV